MPKEKKVKKTEIDNDALNSEESAVETDFRKRKSWFSNL